MAPRHLLGLNKRFGYPAIVLLMACMLAACSSEGAEQPSQLEEDPAAINTEAGQKSSDGNHSAEESEAGGQGNAELVIDEQPSTVYYEIFVRSFYDSDGDGIGDLNGITEKLDYLNDGQPGGDDLGVGGIWLMPINPSPSYHGYDVTDYYDVHPDYGTKDDLKHLLDEAHERGIKVIMDLVVNHTSTEHPWFKESSASLDSAYRDWYSWAEDTGENTTGMSAAGSGPAWHELGGKHYLGTFWSGMPDLNFDHEDVRSEMLAIGQHWLEFGFDGFRLDAAKHIYEDVQSDRSAETTEKNVAWWQEFRTAMNQVKEDAYIVGEVWENSPVSVAPYLDHAFDSGFNFGLADQIIRTVTSETNGGFIVQLTRNYELFNEKSGGAFVDAVFLANHDQNRVMSQLGGSADHAHMAASILLTLPGNPFIYYGEEIGMEGAKPDEQIREPMLWYQAEAGAGQTTWQTPKHNLGEDAVSVEDQLQDSSSLLSHYRELIDWRNASSALTDGTIAGYDLDDDQLLGYVRAAEDERVLVLHNLSNEEKEVALDDSEVKYSELLHATNAEVQWADQTLTLPPYTSVIIK
ncbi:alpha-amylase family glycosyl hydrolase [Paenibacillus urinalis]|uniref:alpha-amylase family glycosyl hydrolase n=1 Tax=Paenibacillus urinalis TaxID=521520 RepID=UPI003640512B